MQIKDLTGQRFGTLVVTAMLDRRGPQGQIYWSAVCDCGGSIEVRGASLKTGNTKSCGCVHAAADHSGQQFGRLTAIGEAWRGQGGVRWLCRCECGGEKVVLATVLRRGLIQSCGCEAKEKWSRAGKARARDLTGQRFGRLSVTGRAGRSSGSNVVWACACECGQSREVIGADLTRGRTTSCGCHVEERKARCGALSYRRDMQATRQSNRRAKLAGAGGSHTQAEVDALFQRQGARCANPYCLASIADGYQRDHIVPVVRDGSSNIANIQLLCRPCNRRKWSTDPVTWLERERARAAA